MHQLNRPLFKTQTGHFEKKNHFFDASCWGHDNQDGEGIKRKDYGGGDVPITKHSNSYTVWFIVVMVVQISPANAVCMYERNVVQLNI